MRKKRKQPEEQNFWQSYSDMMAALLLVFVLIIMFVISRERRLYEESKASYEEMQKNIEEYQSEVADQQEQIDQIIGIRGDIIGKLVTQFSGSNMNLTIDAETGAIVFDSNLLFDSGQYELKPDGIEFLNEFLPQYFDVILSEDIKDYVAEVIIEGHTDTDGAYLYNLDLSQKRAFSVAEYCLGEKNDMFSSDYLSKIRQIVTANGRSYSDPVYDKEGNIDATASRRVEVKFRLTEEDMIMELQKTMEILK